MSLHDISELQGATNDIEELLVVSRFASGELHVSLFVCLTREEIQDTADISNRQDILVLGARSLEAVPAMRIASDS